MAGPDPDAADEADGFDLLEDAPRTPWTRPAGAALMAAGVVALAWAFSLLLGATNANVPAQSPVPLAHPLALLGALALALTLLCAGGLAWSLAPKAH